MPYPTKRKPGLPSSQSSSFFRIYCLSSLSSASLDIRIRLARTCLVLVSTSVLWRRLCETVPSLCMSISLGRLTKIRRLWVSQCGMTDFCACCDQETVTNLGSHETMTRVRKHRHLTGHLASLAKVVLRTKLRCLSYQEASPFGGVSGE